MRGGDSPEEERDVAEGDGSVAQPLLLLEGPWLLPVMTEVGRGRGKGGGVPWSAKDAARACCSS